jgi:hypothetical protein
MICVPHCVEEKMSLPWLTMEDVALRLIRRKRFWFHGPPVVSVEGEPKQMGKLKFEFPDDTVEFAIYLQDKQEIEDIANLMVVNIQNIEIFDDEGNYN